MHARERAIRDRFGEQACNHCGALYSPSSVICLAHRHSAWIVMATCGRCERQGIFVVTFPPRDSGAPPIQGGAPSISHRSPRAFPSRPSALPHFPRSVSEPLPPLPPSSVPLPATPPPVSSGSSPAPPVSSASPAASRPESPLPGEPITAADVDAMHDFLAHFEGNFGALFAGHRAPHPEDPSA